MGRICLDCGTEITGGMFNELGEGLYTHLTPIACIVALKRRIAELELLYQLSQGRIELGDKRIAELEAERRWIPVEERLPHTDDVVVIACKGGEEFHGYYSHKHKTWHYDDGYSVRSSTTHWMPLPSPPEEE